MESSSLAVHLRPALLFASIGALSFWTPDLVVHAWARDAFDSSHVRAITFLMPAALLIAYLISRRRVRENGFRWVGLAMIGGVWLTGGLFIMLCATVDGAGFASAGFVLSVLLLIGSAIPILTCMLATYDGSLGALLIITAVATVIWAYEESGLREPLSRRPKATLRGSGSITIHPEINRLAVILERRPKGFARTKVRISKSRETKASRAPSGNR
ncbi:MAG TPA: hypothetical protein VGI45_11300 [Terracidiphilus sp.]|jgi:hypothetical protein